MKFTKKHRKNLSLSWKGRIVTWGDKVSKALKGHRSGKNNPFFGKKHTLDTKNRIRLANIGRHSGEKHPNWKGGAIRSSYPFDFNKALKELIRKRDNYKCQLCGCPQEECFQKLSVHHIDYNKENLNPKNLTALCNSCNTKVNVNRFHWQKLLKK